MNNSGEILTVYRSEAFNPDDTTRFDLLIRISPSGFVCMVAEVAPKSVLLLESFHQNLPDTGSSLQSLGRYLLNLKWMHSSWNSVRVIWADNRATMIPDALCSADDLEAALSLNITLQQGDKVLKSEVPFLDAQCIFALKGEYYNQLNGLLPHVQISHITGILSSFGKHIPSGKTAHSILAFTEGNLLFVHAFGERGLLLHNCFGFNHQDKLLYFLISAKEKAGATVGKSSLMVSGDMGPESHAFRYITEFLPGTEIFNINLMKHLPSLPSVNWYQFPDLLHQAFCG